MAWRLAKSLAVLRDQVNAAYPGRDKSSDGTVGDASHAAGSSDHNPNSAGVVTAMDITNDPAHGLTARELAETLVASRDPRIKYIISNAQIVSSKTSPWVWRPYSGANAHRAHVHISVMGVPSLWDDERPWTIKPGQPSPQPQPAPPIPRPDIRRRMAKAIVDFEARRDSKGNLAVYQLPAGDGGGTYEVAGINDGFHPKEAAALAAMIRAGKYDEAELYVQDFLVRYTDVVAPWSTDYGVEFYLRDCCFNRGPGGAARILQRAVRVPDDGKVGLETLGRMAGKGAEQLLVALRGAREQYERDVAHRDESSKFWKGLVNRWNNALAQARKFSAESPAGKLPAATKTTPTTKVGIGGGVALAIAAVVHWLGAHWLLTGSIAGAVFLLVVLFVMNSKSEAE